MELLKESFKNNYSLDSARYVKSPLRVCPLGAHVDHQHGNVTGITLDKSIDMLYVPNEEGYIRLQSIDFPDEEYFHVDNVPDMLPLYWGNYMRGAVLSLQRNYKIKKGLNGVISGKIPIGGLSSSAAVTTAYLLALCDVNEIEVSKEALIECSHWVETQFIGLNNGVLDQAANILSLDNYLMFMDCRDNEYKMIPKNPKMPKFEVIVVYSGITKPLISTDYNNRVDECKIAATLLQELSGQKLTAFKDIRLGQIDREVYEDYREDLPGRFKRRADHFFSENERVLKGVANWALGDIKAFGKLMFESGESSVSQYECGCEELITIFNILKETEGVYGARFSGAGYRGCCIGLVNPAYKESIEEKIRATYPVKHPAYKDIYQIHFCKTDDGARVVGDIKL